MNKYILRSAVILGMLGMASCSKKLLDLHPTSSIDLSSAFQKASDAKHWDDGFYASLRGNVYGQFIMAPDIQADQLNATVDYGNNYGFFQLWTALLAADQNIGPQWAGYYNALANINEALAGFQLIVPQNASDSATLKECTGDAYLMRAFYYLKLVLRWSKSYNSSTASTDLGVPLVLKYDLTALPARATVAQVYAQILSDIATARGLLSGITGTPGSSTFTQDAATALSARTRLYMQDWAGAKAAADSLIGSGNYPLVSDQATFINMWTKDLPNESILQLNASQPNEVPNAVNVYLNYNSATGANDPLYLPSQWVVDMFDNADIRKNAYFINTTATFQNGTYTVWQVSKFPGNPALFTGVYSNYEQSPKIFRIAEMYLISAEAAANEGQAAAAGVPLNELRAARGLPAITVATITADSLTNAIRDERFRELAFEGFRLDDLERWNLGFTRHDPQNINVLVPNYTTVSQPAGADKFVWGIPTNDMTINPNLVQNPGW
ncbi:RagB/SusD family nutrient uptake outer membrane protein [Dinghuibacter silviterrae]|uniref:Putative outer membrane starch-binding protein n=1 Tax=Dinghuibacter silviterrae TaxID=1539049 RepID=A0A4V3GLT4_9BACT|nr:RagB/SusD family nutrient uptake outer membrane protein [Dinghuibacter silviterrae]TDX00813.1 putative outer membrane starch-binding protein [Dinghuibacter silviterrae]